MTHKCTYAGMKGHTGEFYGPFSAIPTDSINLFGTLPEEVLAPNRGMSMEKAFGLKGEGCA